MVTKTGVDSPSLVLTPEIAPGLLRMTGPYSGQLEDVYTGEYPVGGPELPPPDAGLNASGGLRPAQGLEP